MLIFLIFILFITSPYSKAIFKSKSHFVKHNTNDKVFYEPGAKHYADKIAAYLQIAVDRVEQIHGLPFTESFNVYICNTQKSLNEYIAQPIEAPIRGTVIFGNIIIAPSAFNWRGEDTHRGSILHELSHLHMKQHLGFWAERSNIPVWFKEGLANLVCNCAGEGISNEEAIEAIRSGYNFIPDKSGSIFKVIRAPDYGIDYAMFHRQTKMFVTFLVAYDNNGFNDFLLDIFSKKSFADSFNKRFGADVIKLWESFVKENVD